MVLASWWQESIPAEVNWILALMGSVAFVFGILAIPSIAQTFWGMARLEREYKTDPNNEDRSLIVFLANPPVRNRLLKRVGVRRVAIQSLEASFQIREAGSGTILDPVRHAALKSTEERSDEDFSYRIVLPPTYSVGASLMVALWDNDTASAVVPPDQLRPPIALAQGLYQVEIVFLVDGEPLRETSKFKVGHRGDDLMWIGSASK